MLALVAVTVLVAGCGGSAGSDTGSPSASAKVAGKVPRLDIGVTDGRIGPATRETAGGALREIGRGGRVDPSAVEPRDREGVGAGASCPDVSTLPDTDTLAAVAKATICLVNGERRDRGLVALNENGLLSAAALVHAKAMVEQQFFAHDGRDGSSMTDRVDATGYLPRGAKWSLGENLAWGTGSLATATAIVNSWMNSEAHRLNILDPEFREIGVGAVLGNPSSTNGKGATYVHEFGYRTGGGTGPDPDTDTGDASTTPTRPSSRVLSPRAAKKARARCRRKKSRKARRACLARVTRATRRR